MGGEGSPYVIEVELVKYWLTIALLSIELSDRLTHKLFMMSLGIRLHVLDLFLLVQQYTCTL